MSAIQRRRGGAEVIKSDSGSWSYDDPDEQRGAMTLLLNYRFNLAALDDWIEGRRWDNAAALREVLTWRRRAIGAAWDGNRPLAQTLATMLIMAVDSDRRDAKRQLLVDRLPARGERKTVAMPQSLPDEIRARNERILAASDRGNSKQAIATAEGVSESTVARIRRQR